MNKLTVAELKKELRHYPDDWLIVYKDDCDGSLLRAGKVSEGLLIGEELIRVVVIE